MGRVDLSISKCDGQVVVAQRGELDVVAAASAAVVRGEIAGSRPVIIVGRAILEFIDSGGLAALAYARRRVRHAGGDLLLAAAQQQVLRFLSLTHLADALCARVAAQAAAGNSGRSQPAAAHSAALAAP
jgi:anti-anti-sigma factor